MNISTLFTTIRTALAGVAVAFSASALTACGGDDEPTTSSTEWEVSPYSIQMRVIDADDANLLDAKNTGNVLADSITAEYLGNAYKLDTMGTAKAAPYSTATSSTTNVKFIEPVFYGLTRYTPVGTRNYVMLFGEFGGAQNVDGGEIVIHWNREGVKNDTITFSHTYALVDGKPQTSTTVKLNHKDTTMPVTLKK